TLTKAGLVPNSSVTGALAPGNYQYTAHYSGDAAFAPADSVPELLTVTVPPPAISTSANPGGTVTLGSSGVTLTDSATLSGGSNPTGTITFTLTHNNTIIYTDHVTVNGDGTYTTSQGDNPGGFPLPTNQTVTGTYLWHAHYSGDNNGNTAADD